MHLFGGETHWALTDRRLRNQSVLHAVTFPCRAPLYYNLEDIL